MPRLQKRSVSHSTSIYQGFTRPLTLDKTTSIPIQGIFPPQNLVKPPDTHPHHPALQMGKPRPTSQRNLLKVPLQLLRCSLQRRTLKTEPQSSTWCRPLALRTHSFISSAPCWPFVPPQALCPVWLQPVDRGIEACRSPGVSLYFPPGSSRANPGLCLMGPFTLASLLHWLWKLHSNWDQWSPIPREWELGPPSPLCTM